MAIDGHTPEHSLATNQPGQPMSLRLLADDLTGALDTAAELVGLTGPVQTYWHGAVPQTLPANAALDSGTRELMPAPAAAIVTELTAHLTGAVIAYKKIDSLLRGSTLAELAACMRAGGWQRCVLAPAFPHQGRATRNGRQYARDLHGRWAEVGSDIIAALRAQGAVAQAGRPCADLPPGISVFDAETDDDLRTIAALGRSWPGPILWSGTGGLARALVGHAAVGAPVALPRPILGLFGSDQPVTAAQLAACGTHWTTLPDGGSESAVRLTGTLRDAGIALASVDLPAGLTRPDAALRIGAAMDGLAGLLEPPGTLVVAGGETLRGLCVALGAQCLEVQGSIQPGLPWSILRGGRWDGVTVVSKSGAFGSPGLLRDLLFTNLH
jgi:uncharacterized protein YgbK (DUF1537 family)